MKALSGRDFARLVERRGWTLLRVKGSHLIYGKPGSIVRLTIPIHGQSPAQDWAVAAFGEACRN
jgi:predicted RNA binding protein YcfA (HicA-like mRNA interferase family)